MQGAQVKITALLISLQYILELDHESLGTYSFGDHWKVSIRI